MRSVVRLSDHVVRPALKSANDVIDTGEIGDQEDRDVFQRCVRLQSGAERVAVHLGHQGVTDNDVRPLVAGPREALEAVRRHRDTVPGLLQKEPELFRLSRAGLYHQHPLRHLLLPCPAASTSPSRTALTAAWVQSETSSFLMTFFSGPVRRPTSAVARPASCWVTWCSRWRTNRSASAALTASPTTRTS